MGLYGSPQLHPATQGPLWGPSEPELPRGARLAQDEHLLRAFEFRHSAVAFYLHAKVVLTDRRLLAARPNTVLGLIPAGTRLSSFPVESISGVAAATHLGFRWVLACGLAALIGLNALSDPTIASGGVVWLIIAALLLLRVPKQAIEVTNAGGQTVRVPVSLFERSRAVAFANSVSDQLARVRPSTPTPAIVPAPEAPHADAPTALRQLLTLQEQGLISADEYAAKRREILARL